MNNKNINRRSALRLGLFGVAAGGVATTLGPHALGAPRVTGLGSQAGVKKLLLIFLRGGNDGINTLIPAGDPAYFAARTMDPNVPLADEIGIQNADSIPLTGFAHMHPALQDILPMFNTGELALMHRIGNPFPSFSHFTSQQYWETGYPGRLFNGPGAQVELLENGFVTKAFANAAMLSGNTLPGASVSNNLMRLFASNIPDEVLAHIPKVDGFDLNQGALPTPAHDKLLNALAGTSTSTGAFDVAQGGSNATLLGATGNAAFAAQSALVAAQNYTPSPNALYPTSNMMTSSGPLPNNPAVDGFGRQLRDAVALLKNTDARIVGVELGGFDTHSDQGGKDGQHAGQLRTLAAGMLAIHNDMQNSALDPETVMLTMSEFGRTSKMNGSAGTDHATSSVMLAMGPSVNGGVYNCSPGAGPGEWSIGSAGNLDGDLFSEDGKYLSMVTDYRAVLAEVLDKHLGVSRVTPGGQPSEMNSVLHLYDVVKIFANIPPGSISMDDLGIL